MKNRQPKLAVIALTEHAVQIGQRLANMLPHADLFAPDSLANAHSRARPFHGRLADLLPQLIAQYDGLVCVMALGIVVRLVGPLARDKSRDPAVVVVDEAGQFAISVLGGHQAGANKLARQVAEILGATPVITTASDALALPAPDLIGRDLGWRIEQPEHLTTLAAEIVNGRPVAVYQDAGETDWWQAFGAWPQHLEQIGSLADLDGRFATAIVISDRVIADELAHWPGRAVLYRPPTLCLGIGCRRGTTAEEIEELVTGVLRAHELAIGSIATVATAWLKEAEPGLIEFARRVGAPLRTFSADELRAAGPLPNPSERVRARVGLEGVAEPAAMLAADSRQLVVPKQIGPRVTVAVARRATLD